MQGRICLKLIVIIVLFAQNAHSQVVSSSELLNSLEKDLRSNLESVFIQARNPHTVGAPPYDAVQVNNTVLELERQFERYLQEASSYVNQPEILLFEEKTARIFSYFTQLSLFVLIRSSLGKQKYPIDLDWLRKYAFPLSISNLHALSDENAFNLRSSNQYPVVIDRTTDDHVYLRLSLLNVNSMEQDALTNVSTEKNYFTLVRYLMTLWLSESYQDLTLFFQTMEPLPNAPSKLVEAYEGFKNLGQMLKRSEAVSKEAKYRKSLNEHSDIVGATFATDAFIRQMMGAILPVEIHEEYFDVFKSMFQESEKVDFKEVLGRLLMDDAHVFLDLSPAKLLSILKRKYIQAKVAVVESLLPDPNTLSAATAFNMAEVLTTRTASFKREVFGLDDKIQSWFEKSELLPVSPQKMISNYTKKLIEASKDYDRLIHQSDEMLKVDLVALDVSLKEAFFAMGLGELTVQRKAMIVQEASYAKAFTMFQEFLASLEEKIRIFEQENSDALAPLQSQNLKQLRKEHSDLVKVAELFFAYDESQRDKENTIFIEGHDVVFSDLSLSAGQIDSYKKTLEIKMLGVFPVLLIEDENEEFFYKELLSVDVEDFVSFEIAKERVMAGLQTVKKNILNKIQAVYKADNIEDLRVILSKSPLLSLLIQNYPSLSRHHENLKDLMNNPSFTQLTWEEMHHRVTSRGFLFLIAHMVIKFIPAVRSHPLSRGVDKALQPYMGYFMLTAFSMIGVNAVWEYQNMSEQYEEVEELKEYYLTAVEGQSLTDYFIISKAQNEAEASWFSWKIQRAMELMFFVGLPLGGRFAKRYVAYLKSSYYESLFQKVGFSKGHYRWFKSDIESVSKATIKDIKLNSKIPQPLKEVAIRQVETAKKKLFRVLNRRQKVANRMARHYKEEFEALRLEPGTWDPAEILPQLNKMEAWYKEGLISAKEFEAAQRATVELMEVVTAPFKLMKPDSAIAELERRFIFVREHVSTHATTRGVTVTENGFAKYVDFETQQIDPVMYKKVRTIEVSDPAYAGQEFTVVTYERLEAFKPRQFKMRHMFKWPKWILNQGKETLKDEGKFWKDVFKHMYRSWRPEKPSGVGPEPTAEAGSGE